MFPSNARSAPFMSFRVFSCLFVLVFSSDAVIHVVEVDRNGE